MTPDVVDDPDNFEFDPGDVFQTDDPNHFLDDVSWSVRDRKRRIHKAIHRRQPGPP
ncbi:MAG TPA: hypothetical protein VHV82_02055 [Sporichthyaceae bacterium]|nr:hypothetical protein [Sporichthyaceae bacterium]